MFSFKKNKTKYYSRLDTYKKQQQRFSPDTVLCKNRKKSRTRPFCAPDSCTLFSLSERFQFTLEWLHPRKKKQKNISNYLPIDQILFFYFWLIRSLNNDLWLKKNTYDTVSLLDEKKIESFTNCYCLNKSFIWQKDRERERKIEYHVSFNHHDEQFSSC